MGSSAQSEDNRERIVAEAFYVPHSQLGVYILDTIAKETSLPFRVGSAQFMDFRLALETGRTMNVASGIITYCGPHHGSQGGADFGLEHGPLLQQAPSQSSAVAPTVHINTASSTDHRHQHALWLQDRPRPLTWRLAAAGPQALT